MAGRHALWIALWLTSAAFAQEPSQLEVRRFLSQGPGAPHPALPTRALARAHVEVESEAAYPALGRRARWLLRSQGRPWIWVDVSEAGTVCHYALSRAGDLIVPRWRDDLTPRPEEEIRAEVQARSLLDDRALEQRARRFLRRIQPAMARRRFELERIHRFRENPVAVSLTFVEHPRAGVLACYPNVLGVTLNPETGQVTEFSGTWVEAELTAPPPVDSGEASRLGRSARPGATLSDPELTFLIHEGAPRAVWLMHGAEEPLVVDAHTGLLLPARES